VGSEEDDLAATIAYQLGVRSLPEETASDALVRHLTDRAALVVIDNCEHVPRACAALVSRLLMTCRDVCVVATTRRALRIDGEYILAVNSMTIDEAGRNGLPSDAVQLLLERAGGCPGDTPASQETLALAARICRALDGLPLAIELAAGQVPARALEGVVAEVEAMMRGERRLHELASDDPRRPERQRTIESTIDWSYQLLSDRERRALQRLAVFRGTFGVREAQLLDELGDGDTGSIASLVDCSMVAAAPPLHGASRLRLVEPIRAFARDLLQASGELEIAREAHAAVFHELAIATAPLLFGPQEQVGLQRLEADHDNLRAALAWYVEGERGHASLRMVGALWWLWFSHGHLEEGCAWVQRALAIGGEPTQERVRALRAGSHLAWWRGDNAQAAAHNAALEACADAIEDDWGRAWVPMALGAAQMFRDPTASLPLFEESKHRFDALELRWEAGYALQLIGGARWFAGDERAAGVAYEEAVEIFAGLGHRSVLASVQRGAGLMAARCGRAGHGAVLCEDALRHSDAIEDRAGSAQALNFLAAISRDAQDLTTAVARYAEALRLAREVGDLWATCWALDGLAGAARSYGDAEIAAQLISTSGKLADRSHYVQPPHERELRDAHLAALRLELDEGELEHASAEGAVLGVGDAVASALAFAARYAEG
jgi:predicted ATPase